jgi:hypothetical protein
MVRKFAIEFVLSLTFAGVFYFAGNTSLFVLGLILAFGVVPGHLVKEYLRETKTTEDDDKDE